MRTDVKLGVAVSMVVVLITAFGDIEMAVRAIKEGASDFVLKPWQNEAIEEKINHILRIRKTLKSEKLLDVINGVEIGYSFPNLKLAGVDLFQIGKMSSQTLLVGLPRLLA